MKTVPNFCGFLRKTKLLYDSWNEFGQILERWWGKEASVQSSPPPCGVPRLQMPDPSLQPSVGAPEGGSMPPPPVFCRSVNHIPTRGSILCPSHYYSPPRFSDLPTVLFCRRGWPIIRLWEVAWNLANSNAIHFQIPGLLQQVVPTGH